MQLEHYMSEEKLFNSNSAVKMVEKRCKSAQTSTKCRSIILKFGQKILCNLLNLTAQAPLMGGHVKYLTMWPIWSP